MCVNIIISISSYIYGSKSFTFLISYGLTYIYTYSSLAAAKADFWSADFLTYGYNINRLNQMMKWVRFTMNIVIAYKLTAFALSSIAPHNWPRILPNSPNDASGLLSLTSGLFSVQKMMYGDEALFALGLVAIKSS